MLTTWSQLNTLKTIPLYEMAIEHSGSSDKHSTTYVSHFPLHFFRARQTTKKKKNFFRALAVFCVLYNRTEHFQASLFVKYSWLE